MQEEQTQVSNRFGTVTNRRVVYARGRRWFGGGAREDIPLRHVTSVRIEGRRNFVAGLLALMVGGSLLEGPMVLFGVPIMALGGLSLWGFPTVIVNTAGRDMNAAQGAPWHMGEARAFVESLRSQLFRQGAAGDFYGPR